MTQRFRRQSVLTTVAASAIAFATPAFAAADQDPAVSTASDDSSAIVVTARRREERLQDVPVSITAATGEELRQANLVTVQEIQQKVPGLTMQPGNFGTNVLAVAIRGQRQTDPYITKEPAVGVYFADVIMNRPQGLNAAMFDLQSVQVLKGPQGTLFGRNTTGGAMIITPQAPTSRFEGYVLGGIGNLESRRLEGAINVPLGDWAALRVGGSLVRRKGYTQNITTGQRLDDEHKDSWRVSLKLNPVDGLENRTVVAGFIANENGTGYKLVAANANQTALLAEIARLGTYPFHTTSGDLPMQTRVQAFTVANTTQYQFSPELTIKNIFGYRHVTSAIPFDLDGSNVTYTDITKTASKPLGRLSATGEVVQLAPSREDMTVDQYSNELQALGTVLDGSLDYIVGGYYFLERGRDLQRSGGILGVSDPSCSTTPAAASCVYLGTRATLGDPIRNRSTSAFLQFTWRVPFIPGFSLTAGGRQTHDVREITSRNYVSGTNACRLSGFDAATQAACAASFKTSYNRFTYTLSADYKVSPDVLLYVAHRKGYRAGGFNISAVTPSGFIPFLPEDVKDYELGLKTSFRMGGGSGTFNVAAYKQDYKNIQRNQGTVVNGVFFQTIVNAASATIKGFEADLSLHPAPWLDVGLNVANIDAKYKSWLLPQAVGPALDVSPSLFAGAPAWTISGNIAITVPVGASDLRFSADYYHSTKSVNTDTTWDTTLLRQRQSSILPAYSLLNGRIELQKIAGREMSLAVWGKNLTNQKYYLNGTDLTSSTGFAANFMAPPRTYGVELRYAF